MSSFDARVWQWVQTAQVARTEKLALVRRCLSCLPDNPDTQQTRRQMSAFVAQLQTDLERWGDGIDETAAAASQTRAANGGGAVGGGYAFGEAGADGGEAEAAASASGGEDEGAGSEGPRGRVVNVISDEDHGEALARNSRGRSARRKTVSSEVINVEDVDGYTPPVHEKDAADAQWLQQTLETQYLFEHLERADLAVLVAAMQRRTFAAGEAVFTEGEEGDTFFVLQSGAAEGRKDGEVVKALGAGDCVGEEELMYSAEAQFTLEAVEDETVLWALERETYRHIVTKASVKKRALYAEFLEKIDFLEGLTSFERLQVADALKTTEYADGEKVIRFGEEGSHFHIIVEGTLKVVGRAEPDDPDSELVDVCTFGVGDCVGELEFINEHKTCADVVAVGDVKTAKMGRKHFEKVMGPMKEFLRDRYKDSDKFEYYRKQNLEQ